MLVSLLVFLCASASLVLAVPILHNPLKLQLVSSNPALSSVYFPLYSSVFLSNESNLIPALRVPPTWSFSIGLSGDTFLPGEGDAFDDLSLSVQMNNGDPVPYWLKFHPSVMTLNGVAPADVQSQTIVVEASVGNVSVSDSFILIISPHDMAMTTPFKGRNITTHLPFSVVIDDFENIVVDDYPVNVPLPHFESRISPINFGFNLVVDTTAFSWVAWDSSTFSLHGTGPLSTGTYTLPIMASTSFPNQHLNLFTNITLNAFTSYFNTSWLPPQFIRPGSPLEFDLDPFTIPESRNDPGWAVSIDNSAPTSWITFNLARLSLNGIVPRNITNNLRIIVTARHMDHNVTNHVFLDLVVDPNSTNTHQVKEKRLSHPVLSKIFKGVLGIGLAVLSVVLIALVSAYILSKRRSWAKKKEHFGAIGIAYSYQDPISKYSQRPVQRVFDNFSIASSPGVGGRLTTTKAIFDAIRNRLRGERLAYPGGLGRNQQRRSPGPFGKAQAVSTHGLTTRNGLPQRPRKSKIGRPIAIPNGSTGLFSDLIANNLPRTASFRQTQESRSKEVTGPTILEAPIKLPLSHFSRSCPQFTPYADIPPRPLNPILKSTPVVLREMSSNDAPSRMKAVDFLANKRKAILRDHTSSSEAMLSITSNKVRPADQQDLCGQVSHQTSFPIMGNRPATKTPNDRSRTIYPHFGESSLEDIRETEASNTSNDLLMGVDKLTDTWKRTVMVDQSDREETEQNPKQLLDSPNPSSEEYFGSASNESVAAAFKGQKLDARRDERPLNLPSVAITVPSVYSEVQHPATFPISSYSIAARQPFAFTFDVPTSKVDGPMSYIAKQHNGAELPPWLRFDKTTNEFWGVTPGVKKGNAINVEIDIWDPKTDCVIAGTDVEVLG